MPITRTSPTARREAGARTGQGFIYQGESIAPSRRRTARHAQRRSAADRLRQLCLQNHDQIGNRALGERLTRLADPDALRAATALLLLCPQIPLIFMGDELGVRKTRSCSSPTSMVSSPMRCAKEGARNSPIPSFSDPKSARRSPIPTIADTYRPIDSPA
jgi:maltooligosyltrehalose trehalohydrolase